MLLARVISIALLISIALVASSLGDVRADESSSAEAIEATSRYRAMRTFDVDLPHVAWKALGEQLDFRAGGGPLIDVVRSEGAIRFDRDGDGEAESTLSGDTAFHVFKRAAPSKDARAWRAALRFRNTAAGWQYAASGAMRFKVNGEAVLIFDANTNGRYDDIGTDAMLVGVGKTAWPLSSTVHLRTASGERVLHDLTLTAGGGSLVARPYRGAVGRLDLRSDFVSKGRLLAARVVSSDGRHSFELAFAESGRLVPVGPYQLHSARVGLGTDTVHARTGRAAPMQVQPDKPTVLSWGGALTAEFEYQRQGNQVVFQPERMWFYGRAGETWERWTPFGDSPQFIVRAGARGADGVRPEIARAVFTGC